MFPVRDSLRPCDIRRARNRKFRENWIFAFIQLSAACLSTYCLLRYCLKKSVGYFIYMPCMCIVRAGLSVICYYQDAE